MKIPVIQSHRELRLRLARPFEDNGQEGAQDGQSESRAISGMGNIFISYSAIIRKHGLSWLNKANLKVAVRHIMSVIKPKPLRLRLESDLRLGHYNFKQRELL